jgi:hypothetical protein
MNLDRGEDDEGQMEDYSMCRLAQLNKMSHRRRTEDANQLDYIS